MQDKSLGRHLGMQIRAMLVKEHGEYGLNVFKEQCRKLNVNPEQMKVADLPGLSQRVIAALRPMVGDERAQKSGKEILKLKILADLTEIDAKREDPLRDRKRLEAYHKLGNISQTIGDWDDALEYYAEVASLGKRLGDKAKAADAHKGRGHIYKRRSNWDLAIAEFNEALALSEKAGYPAGTADSHRGLGYVYWRRGEYGKAMEHHKLAFQWVRKTKDAALEGTIHIETGLVHSDLGELDKAAEEYGKAIELLERERDYQSLARAHNNLGDVHLQKEEWAEAIRHFDLCHENSARINHQMMLGWSLFNSAEALSRLKRPDEALERCAEAMAILGKLDDAVGIVAVHRNLGLAYRFKRDFAKSEKEFKEAETLAGRINSPFNSAHLQLEWGQMLMERGDARRGKDMIRKAANTFGEIGANRYRDKALAVLESAK